MTAFAKILFDDEVMLAGWRDSHNSGATVTFWVGDSEMLDVFRGLTIRKGKTAGQRLAMVLVEINDDETLAEPQAEPVKDTIGPLCRLAVQWCKDNDFQRWILKKHNYPASVSAEIGTLICSNITRKLLIDLVEIESRRELDTNPEAAVRFQTLIRAPYMKYQLTGVIE